jgi:hypothetical protein
MLPLKNTLAAHIFQCKLPTPTLVLLLLKRIFLLHGAWAVALDEYLEHEGSYEFDTTKVEISLETWAIEYPEIWGNNTLAAHIFQCKLPTPTLVLLLLKRIFLLHF